MAEPNDESAGYLENGVHAAEETMDTRTRDRASSGGSSDSEGGERPVRDKLKKTSIAGLSSKARAGTEKGPHPLQEFTTVEPALLSSSDQLPTSSRGRPARKRSFDDLQNEASQAEADEAPPAKNGHHKRMRSRDVSSGEHVSLPGMSENGIASPVEEESDLDAQKSPGGPGVLVDASISDAVTPPPETSTDPESMISPKKKRSRDQFDTEDNSTLEPIEPHTLSSSQKKESEPDKKRHREEEQAAFLGEVEPMTTIAPPSGFANTSSASPFADFASPKPPGKQALSPHIKPAEPSAFKSSGLSAFASSEKSPFSAFGSPSKSGFGGTTSSGGFGAATTGSTLGGSSTSGFGNTGATSPFGARTGSGFGSLSGLGSTTGTVSAGGFGGGLGVGLVGTHAPAGESTSTFGGPPGSRSTFGRPSTTKQKAFGAPEDEDDSDSGEDSDSQDDEGGEQEDSHHAREARLREQTDRKYLLIVCCRDLLTLHSR
jgi:Ran-binding protein 3